MSRAVRPPAVAGSFYEADPQALRRTVERCLGAPTPAPLPPDSWRALLLPHAGYVYSGGIAGAGLSAVELPERAILLGPNHTGQGAPMALSTVQAWRTPLGDVPVDERLAEALLEEAAPVLTRDDRAHAREHSLEVFLPFLQVARPRMAAVFVCLGEHDLPACREIGRAVAAVVRREEEAGRRVAVLVSSDLNHYLPRPANRKKDDRAVDALLLGDPAELFDRVLSRERISMCGVLPATALLEALRELGGTRGRIVAQGDSADAFGDESRVVGYASVVWERTE